MICTEVRGMTRKVCHPGCLTAPQKLDEGPNAIQPYPPARQRTLDNHNRPLLHESRVAVRDHKDEYIPRTTIPFFTLGLLGPKLRPLPLKLSDRNSDMRISPDSC